MRALPRGPRLHRRVPELAAIADQLAGRRVILDGELVRLDGEDKPDFAALRNRFGRRPGRRSGRVPPVTLLIFDGLHLDGRAVRRLPYAARRELLGGLGLNGPAWRVPHHFVGQAEQLLAATAEQGLEGVVAKRLDSAYREGSSRSWIKHKHRRRERLAVTGWRERDGELPEFLLARPGAGWPAVAGRQRLARVGCRPARRAARGSRGPRGPRPRTTNPGAMGGSGVEVVVDAHGSPSGPVRDALVRAFEVAQRGGGMHEFLTVAEVARILRLNQQTVRNWTDQGSLPALRVGRRVRIRRQDVQALETAKTGLSPTSSSGQPRASVTSGRHSHIRGAHTSSSAAPAASAWAVACSSRASGHPRRWSVRVAGS